MKLHKNEITPSRFEISFNDIILGDAIRDVDGYFYFIFEQPVNGTWQAWTLRAIADVLDELNKAWDDQINAYFEAEKLKENLTTDFDNANDF